MRLGVVGAAVEAVLPMWRGLWGAVAWVVVLVELVVERLKCVW